MKYKTEVFDQVRRLFDVNGFNAHQLHCVLRFDAEAAPDADVLREAVLASIEAYPPPRLEFVLEACAVRLVLAAARDPGSGAADPHRHCARALAAQRSGADARSHVPPASWSEPRTGLLSNLPPTRAHSVRSIRSSRASPSPR